MSQNLRRIKHIKVNPQIFMNLCTTRIGMTLDVVGIPAGAQFRGFCHSYQYNSINVFVEHPSFEEVPEYMEAPELEVKFFPQETPLITPDIIAAFSNNQKEGING